VKSGENGVRKRKIVDKMT